MRSREEIIRLAWTLVGAVLGTIAGFALLTVMLQFLRLSPLWLTIAVLGICGGSLIGGGYLGLTIITKRQRVARKKFLEAKKKRKKRRK